MRQGECCFGVSYANSQLEGRHVHKGCAPCNMPSYGNIVPRYQNITLWAAETKSLLPIILGSVWKMVIGEAKYKLTFLAASYN